MDPPSDVWGLGCVAFELLALRRAFHIDIILRRARGGSGGLHALVKMISAGQVDYTKLSPGSPDAVRLFGACLKVDPTQRLEATRLAAWPWLY